MSIPWTGNVNYPTHFMGFPGLGNLGFLLVVCVTSQAGRVLQLPPNLVIENVPETSCVLTTVNVPEILCYTVPGNVKKMSKFPGVGNVHTMNRKCELSYTFHGISWPRKFRISSSSMCHKSGWESFAAATDPNTYIWSSSSGGSWCYSVPQVSYWKPIRSCIYWLFNLMAWSLCHIWSNCIENS